MDEWNGCEIVNCRDAVEDNEELRRGFRSYIENMLFMLVPKKLGSGNSKVNPLQICIQIDPWV